MAEKPQPPERTSGVFLSTNHILSAAGTPAESKDLAGSSGPVVEPNDCPRELTIDLNVNCRIASSMGPAAPSYRSFDYGEYAFAQDKSFVRLRSGCRQKKAARRRVVSCSLAEEETRLVAKCQTLSCVPLPRRRLNDFALFCYIFILTEKPRTACRPQTACGRHCPWEPTALHEIFGQPSDRPSVTVTDTLSPKAKSVPQIISLKNVRSIPQKHRKNPLFSTFC
jgi:hypothetical protein